MASPEVACCTQSWGDVYLFCGNSMRYCNCDMRWNLRGWVKAAVLWNFVLSSSLAVQKLVIQAGLNGLLPGKDSPKKASWHFVLLLLLLPA